jgi:NADH:flavin oxidoreductases, Old Yellow Enzyme family
MGRLDGFLHAVEASPGEAPANERSTDLFKHLRAAWNVVYIVSGGYGAARGDLAVSDNRADTVAYGRLFLANPDLPRRLRYGGPLNAPDPKSFYGGTELG